MKDVKNALISDNWTITDDNLALSLGVRSVYVDLGAEKVLNATKGKKKIAVEIKSFLGQSFLTELEKAFGQYDIYKIILEEQDPDRDLYLAIPEASYQILINEPPLMNLFIRKQVKLIVFDPEKEVILTWLPHP